MSRPYSPRSFSSGSYTRVNGKIRAREVRVIGVNGEQVGVLSLGDAINMARATWDTGWFPAEIYRQLFQELGYDVPSPTTPSSRRRWRAR